MQSSLAKEFLFPTVSQIGLNYRDSSLSNHRGDKDFKVKAGDRMPYFLVDGANVYDKLRAPKFHLIVFADGEHGHQDLQLEIEHEYRDLIDFNVMPLSPRVVEIFGTNQPFQVLLRPDNYIGCISTAVSLTDLKAYLLFSNERLRQRDATRWRSLRFALTAIGINVFYCHEWS